MEKDNESKKYIVNKEENQCQIMKRRITQYILNNQQKVRDMFYIFSYLLVVFIVLFTVAKVIKTKTNFYQDDLKFRWDNVLSYDDIHYVRNIYQEGNQTRNIYTVVKHPFIYAIGNMVASVENNLFSNMNKTDHYFHIVFIQIIINLLGCYYLYKIIREHFKIENKWCFILITIYELATVTLLGTFMVDSFLISGTLLIMSYYYLAKQKVIPSVLLGVLTTGITITNCIIFAIMVIFLLKNKKDIFKVGISCVILLIFCFVLLPYKEELITNFFGTVNANTENFVKSQDGITWLKMVFYNLLTSPLFFINQSHVIKNGLDFVTFKLSAGRVIQFTIIMMFCFLSYHVIKNRKDRNMLAALAVFIYNMILHGIIKFGLYEGTIYGLHFLFSEILMLAFGFKIKNKIVRNGFIVFIIGMLLIQLHYNLKGMLELMLLLKDWK